MKNENIGFGISFNLTDPLAIKFLSENGFKIRDAYRLKIVENKLEYLSNKIKMLLASEYEKGSTINNIAERLVDELADIMKITFEQALLVARTEIIGAANYARYISITNSGFKRKQWFSANDEDVRSTHRAMHGKTININGLWVFPDGSALRYPGDHEGPDHLVVNCRCIEVVVPESHELLC